MVPTTEFFIILPCIENQHFLEKACWVFDLSNRSHVIGNTYEQALESAKTRFEEIKNNQLNEVLNADIGLEFKNKLTASYPKKLLLLKQEVYSIDL